MNTDFRIVPLELIHYSKYDDLNEIKKYYADLNRSNELIKKKLTYLEYFFEEYVKCFYFAFPSIKDYHKNMDIEELVSFHELDDSMKFYRYSTWDLFLYNPHILIDSKYNGKPNSVTSLIRKFIIEYIENIVTFNNGTNVFLLKSDIFTNSSKIIGLLLGLAELDKKHKKNFSMRKRFIAYYIEEKYKRDDSISFAQHLRYFVREFNEHITDLVSVSDPWDFKTYKISDGSSFDLFYNDIIDYRNFNNRKKRTSKK